MKLPKKPVLQLLLIFTIWRLVLLLVTDISSHILPYRQDFEYSSYTFFHPTTENGLQKYFVPLANFDGVHYLHIAERGYKDEQRFFPLLPLIIRILSFGQPVLLLPISILVCNTIFFAALYTLYRLLRLDHSHEIVIRTILFLLAFPTSFFFGAIYTEGLFLLLSGMALYFSRTGKWRTAVLCTILASATRITGIVLVPVLLIELWQQHKQGLYKQWKNVVLILFGATGLLSYMIYLWKYFSDPLLFLKAHTYLGNSREVGVVFPLQTCFRYLKILLNLSPTLFEWWIALLEVSLFGLAVVSLVWLARKRLRPSYWCFTCLAFLIPTLSGTFTGLPRYILPLFPLFLPLALSTNKKLKVIYLLVAVPLLLVCTVLFSRGFLIA